MQFEASAAKAEGVVGVDIHEGSHGWQTHVIEFFAIGTAVLPFEAEIAPEKIADPIMVLSVNDQASSASPDERAASGTGPRPADRCAHAGCRRKTCV